MVDECDNGGGETAWNIKFESSLEKSQVEILGARRHGSRLTCISGPVDMAVGNSGN